jgi:hypothetical protein
MKKYCVLVFLSGLSFVSYAQELFPSTEPASAMSAKSIGLRLNNELFPAEGKLPGQTKGSSTAFRIGPEIMWGINKKWMLHLNFYGGNMHQPNSKFEGSGMYVKYRFYTSDQVQSHFRLALYGRASVINNPIQSAEINLAGDNSGFGTGIIATQLLHKLALSVTGGYMKGLDNLQDRFLPGQSPAQINYSLSAGFLALPLRYKSYDQPNLNVYMEVLGRSDIVNGSHYLDVAPALQLILQSLIRIDLVWERQVSGDMVRNSSQMIELRFEYNFLNAYK